MKEKISGIYRVVCVKNGDYYYGSAKNIHGRWMDHKRALKRETHYNPRVQRVWNKYGEPTFRIEIVEFIPIERLREVEDVYLKEHVGKPHCMNISSDAYCPTRGRKMGVHSRERREKIRKTLMGHSVSKKTRKKISDAQIGMKRKPHPPISEETRQQMRDSHLGIKYPNRKRVYGQVFSDEVRKRMSESRRPNGFPKVKSPTEQIYEIDILTDFCKTHNLDLCQLSRVINGKGKTCMGWSLA